MEFVRKASTGVYPSGKRAAEGRLDLASGVLRGAASRLPFATELIAAKCILCLFRLLERSLLKSDGFSFCVSDIPYVYIEASSSILGTPLTNRRICLTIQMQVYDRKIVHDLVCPNFFIVGAMKAGTSSLHVHPEIFMCNSKETCYFVDKDDLKKIWLGMYKKAYWEGVLPDRYFTDWKTLSKN